MNSVYNKNGIEYMTAGVCVMNGKIIIKNR